MDYAPNFINLIGQTFGELYVFEKAENDPKGCARFLARCSCGDERRYESKELRDFKRTACPKCLREGKKALTVENREAAAQKILEEKREKFDISGLKVKDWTVLRPVKDGNFGCEYVCQCKCGSLFNFGKSFILRDKTSRFCKKCLLEDNERKRSEKQKVAINIDSAKCRCCNKVFDAEKLDKTKLKSGFFICVECSKEYQNKMRQKWLEDNLLKDSFDCPKCKLKFERNSVPESSLKTKNPLCKGCTKIRDNKLADKYEAVNLKKKEIKCSKCKIVKDLDKYAPSFLRSSSPQCSLCNGSYGRDYDKKRFELDPIYKEKRTIGEKIRKSLSRSGWTKDSTATTYLKIDKDGFINHIKSMFREGMSWENRNEWEIDHVIATSFAETSEDLKILWHYLNLQPLWCLENSRKSNDLNWREQDWTEEILEIRERLGIDNKWKDLGENIASRFFREPFC